jgi:hypothetical protein
MEISDYIRQAFELEGLPQNRKEQVTPSTRLPIHCDDKGEDP